MNEIRAWLYIGNYSDSQNKDQLDFNAVHSVLQLAAPVTLADITALYVPVRDMAPIAPQLLKQGIDFALAEKNKGNKILVACAAGINRSSTFCIAILKEAEGLSLLDAFKAVKKSRATILPQEMAWESLREYYNEDISYLDILRASAEFFK